MTFKKENIYLLELKSLLLKQFKSEPVKIVLFGSRAKRNNSQTSDIDIGLMPYGKINGNKISLTKETLENLNIPYKIELVNLEETDNDFKNEALKGAITWKE